MGKWGFLVTEHGKFGHLLLLFCSSQGSEASRRSPAAQRDSRGNQDIAETRTTQILTSRFAICSAAVFLMFFPEFQRDQKEGAAWRCCPDACNLLCCALKSYAFSLSSSDMCFNSVSAVVQRDLLLLSSHVAEGWRDTSLCWFGSCLWS